MAAIRPTHPQATRNSRPGEDTRRSQKQADAKGAQHGEGGTDQKWAIFLFLQLLVAQGNKETQMGNHSLSGWKDQNTEFKVTAAAENGSRNLGSPREEEPQVCI